MTTEVAPEMELATEAQRRKADDQIREEIRNLIATWPPPPPDPRPLEQALAEQRTLNQPSIDLLKKWDEEDAALTPEELAQAQREWEEFRDALNETRRLEGRPPAFP